MIGQLLRQLDRPATPQLAPLSGEVARLVRALASPPAGLPRRFVEQALSLAPDLVRDEGADARLVHTDLHYANVLSGQRQPWLAIDPKPLAAEPAYAVAPALWNRWEEAVAGSDVRGALRRRLSVVCEHGGIDEDRAPGLDDRPRGAERAVGRVRAGGGGPGHRGRDDPQGDERLTPAQLLQRYSTSGRPCPA